MTDGPLDGGGHPVTVKKTNSTLLTEYASGSTDTPLLIINTSTDPVWLAADSGVGPSNGIPLAGGTSLPWTSSGQVWAIADASAAGNVTLVITSAATDWQASPAAIATQVAQQLLQTGVPNVLVQDEFQVLVPGGGQSAAVDISGYASLVLAPLTSGGVIDVTIQQISGSGLNEVIADAQAFHYDPAWTMPVYSLEMSVSGGTLTITNNLPGSATFNVIGSNRPAASLDGRFNDIQGYHGQVAFGSAGVFAFPAVGVAVFPVKLQGQCYARFALTGGGATRGSLQLVNNLGAFTLIDGTDMVTSGAVGVAGKMIALPAGAFDLRANVSTFVAAGAAILDVVPVL